MKTIPRFPRALRFVVLASAVLASTMGTAIPVAAQSVSDLQPPRGPLVLKAKGSFFVGGETILQTATETGALFGLVHTSGHLAINQMYVQYMVPEGGESEGYRQQGDAQARGGQSVPVVMIHGGTLSGKSYETTPDGRMGWDEYFVRKGHAVYVPDQIGRARSGFNQAVYNDVRAGISPPSAQGNILRVDNETAWSFFRFGPTLGVPYPDELFPVAAADRFAEQGIPDLSRSLPTPNPNIKALSDLAILLNGAVLMGHSQAGRFPLEAALTNSAGTKGLIAIEPLGCNATAYTNQQISKLAAVPILIVFGDHLDTVTLFNWQLAFDDCQAFIARVNAANGNARMLWPPSLGIRGNSHMIMQDKNNLQIANLILKWIAENVGETRGR